MIRKAMLDLIADAALAPAASTAGAGLKVLFGGPTFGWGQRAPSTAATTPFPAAVAARRCLSVTRTATDGRSAGVTSASANEAVASDDPRAPTLPHEL